MEEKKRRYLPAIDLHCHLDGSIPIKTMEEILGRRIQEEEVGVFGQDIHLSKYLEKFELPLLCMQGQENLRRVGCDFLCGLASDNIDYVEVRFAPSLCQRQGLRIEEVIEAVLEGLAQGRSLVGIDFQLILCCMRHLPEEENKKMLRIGREFLGVGVGGIDLAGDESRYPNGEYRDLFACGKSLGMPITIHSGECGNANNIKIAIEMGASRIGHGLAMAERGDIQQLCVDKKIGIELCPRSNYQTGAIKDGATYPLEIFLQKGIDVSINTDNRSVSHTTLQKEYAFLQEKGFEIQNMYQQIRQSSIRMSFAPDDIKHKLWKVKE